MYTALSLTFKGGRINHKQAERVRQTFCATPNGRVRILVSHHPFDLPGAAGDEALVGRADMAMAAFRGCMPDLLLAGHVHVQSTGTTAERYRFQGGSAIVVQAGTTTST